jgi:hypothetical protein
MADEFPVVPPEMQAMADALQAQIKAALDKAYAEVALLMTAYHLQIMKKVTGTSPPSQSGMAPR